MCPSFSRQRSKQNVISPSDLGLRASAQQIKFTFMPCRDLHLTSAHPGEEERVGGLHLLELLPLVSEQQRRPLHVTCPVRHTACAGLKEQRSLNAYGQHKWSLNHIFLTMLTSVVHLEGRRLASLPKQQSALTRRPSSGSPSTKLNIWLRWSTRGPVAHLRGWGG